MSGSNTKSVIRISYFCPSIHIGSTQRCPSDFQVPSVLGLGPERGKLNLQYWPKTAFAEAFHFPVVSKISRPSLKASYSAMKCWECRGAVLPLSRRSCNVLNSVSLGKNKLATFLCSIPAGIFLACKRSLSSLPFTKLYLCNSRIASSRPVL